MQAELKVIKVQIVFDLIIGSSFAIATFRPCLSFFLPIDPIESQIDIDEPRAWTWIFDLLRMKSRHYFAQVSLLFNQMVAYLAATCFFAELLDDLCQATWVIQDHMLHNKLI